MDWDRYGSLLRNNLVGKPLKFVDLRPLESHVLPAVTPAGIHTWHDPSLSHPGTTAYVCKSQRCRGYAGAEKILSTPGIKYLMWITDVTDGMTGPEAWLIRYALIKPGPECDWSVEKPKTVCDLIRSPVAHDLDRYPHACPRCSGPAFIGMVQVDCARGCF